MYTLRLYYKLWYYKHHHENFLSFKRSKPYAEEREQFAVVLYKDLLRSMVGKAGPFKETNVEFFARLNSKVDVFNFMEVQRYVLFHEIVDTFDKDRPYMTGLKVFLKYFYFNISRMTPHLHTARKLDDHLADTRYVMFEPYTYKAVFENVDIDLRDSYFGLPRYLFTRYDTVAKDLYKQEKPRFIMRLRNLLNRSN